MVSQKRHLVKPLKINLVNNLWITLAFKKAYVFKAIKKYYVSFITPHVLYIYQPDIYHNDIPNKPMIILRGKFRVAWLWGIATLGLRDPDKMV